MSGSSQMQNIAIVLAAGKGTRFGAEKPKQLVRLSGKPVFEHVLEAFEQAPEIDAIVLVGTEEVLAQEHRLCSLYPKILFLVGGGESRADSTWSGLSALLSLPPETKVLVHDGVRPFVSRRILQDVIAALDRYDAVDTVVDCTDTVVQVECGELTDIPERSGLKRGQTPQGFRLGKILAAFERYRRAKDTKPVTDDCAIYLQYRGEDATGIGVVPGSEANLKLTYAEDLMRAEEILRSGVQQLPFARESVVGKIVVVFGGTSGIGLSLCERLREQGAITYGVGRSTGCDITRRDHIDRTLTRIAQESGSIDAVVLSAGVMCHKPLVEHSPLETISLIHTNLLGAVHVAQQSFPYLKESRGQLLLFSSSSYTRGREGYSLYCATKAALANLSQALAEEWSPFGVRVNCIAPSRTRTPLRLRHFLEEEDQADLLSPSDVAAYAESVLASNLSGKIVSVRNYVGQWNETRHTSSL